jgi:putative hemolysin
LALLPTGMERQSAMEVLLVFGLVLLNGLFAMAELAMVAARRARLAKLADEGDRSAAAALRLHDDPTPMLSTIQIGITSISILNGIVGESVLAVPLATWLQGFGLAGETAHIGATAVVVVAITYVSIVVGELVPKRLAQFNPEGIALRVARPMQVLAMIARPFVRLLSVSTDTILRLAGKRSTAGPSITEAEIHALLEEGSQAGVIDQHERTLVRNVFRLDDRPVGTLMVPRTDIVFLDTLLSLDDNLETVTDSAHSRFPVCRGGLGDVVGTITAKQLLALALHGGQPDLATVMQPAVFVPESLTGMALLEHFRLSATQMVLVVDEFGEVQGLVTLQNVLEALTGEFVPIDQTDVWAVQREDGSWLLDGLIPVPELKDALGLRTVPEEEQGRYHTLSGVVMLLLGRMPQTGDVATWENWRLEVVDLDGKRIDKVLASRLGA